jgi:site-specific recombinase XerC
VINNVVSECRFRLLGDLQGGQERLEQHLANRRRLGASHRTINADLIAVRSLCRWLIDRKRMCDDPTAGLERLNEDEDQRLDRRSLSDDEARRLIETTFRSKRVLRRLTGVDRAMLYLLAQRTGLRRGELRSLTREAFDFSRSPATVTVQAAHSKRRRIDVLPLPADIVDVMKNFVAGRAANELVWAGSWWRQSAKILQRDLADAGIAAIDEGGRVVDFHGQRTTFITGLARAGVSVAMTQKLARHSDVNLTLGTYTRLQIDELGNAVDKLPGLASSAQSSDAGATVDPRQPEAADGDLEQVIAAWPSLAADVREAILLLMGNTRQ